jgi:soluble lytic murein transglycosylase-like protein
MYAKQIVTFVGVFWLAFCLSATAMPSRAYDPTADAKKLTQQATQYEHGEGLPKDPVQAFALYCEAAKLGFADAQFKLAWMVANGRGVPRDNGMAAALFALAADQGHEQASRMRGFMGQAAAHLPPCMLFAEPEPELPPEPPPPRVVATPANASAMRVPSEPDIIPTIDWVRGQAERARVVSIVRRLAPIYGVDPEFALSIITIESAFDPRARSTANAQGLMQLIPATAERFGVRNTFDPTENIRGGLQYLRWLLAYFKGYVPWVAAAYNAGEGNVENYKGVPPFNETRNYVKRLCKLYPKNMHRFDASIVGPSRIATGSLADSACPSPNAVMQKTG